MPVYARPQGKKFGVREVGGFVGKRLRDKGFRDFSKDVSPKTDREVPKKQDRERIFDTKGFKQKLDEAYKGFSDKIRKK
jgi:hypothetical protein